MAENSVVGMFDRDENVNSVSVEDNAEILLKCLENSVDFDLIPVYYQLSQAENEKLKRGEVDFVRAELADAEKIAEIEKANISVNTLSLRDIQQILDNENYVVNKVVFNNELVGFIILEVTDEANIFSIAVKKEFRNLGLATGLIETAKEVCKEFEVDVISLEVSSKNVNAYVLYEKLGFKKRRVRKGYYQDGSDCVEMILNVQL